VSIGVELAAGFAMGFVGSIPLAGPVALLVMTRGLAREFTEARLIAGGASLAEGFIAAWVFAGLGMLYSLSPGLAETVKWLGPLALCLIGLWFFIRGVSPDSGEPASDRHGSGASYSLSLGIGLVIGNPGMIGTWGGAIAALEGTGFVQASPAGAPWFGLAVAAGVFSWFLLMLKVIRSHRGSLNYRVLNLIVKGIGGVLVGAGALSFASLLGAL
jgi:threonine/homoserine/homoserine lactone efflux protein